MGGYVGWMEIVFVLKVIKENSVKKVFISYVMLNLVILIILYRIIIIIKK